MILAHFITLSLVLIESFPLAYAKCELYALTHSERCGNYSYVANCTSSRLQHAPEEYPSLPDKEMVICWLDLSFNNITVLGNGSFLNKTNLTPESVKIMCMNNNNMRNIEPKAFEGLSNLRFLNLTCNDLDIKVMFGKGIFAFTLELQTLHLKQNNFSSPKDMNAGLNDLKNLETLFINPVWNSNASLPEFGNLFNLEILSLSGLTKRDCRMWRVGNITFRNIPNLKRLEISRCNIMDIESGAFQPLKTLEILDISYNEYLKFNGMNKALAGLKNSTSLRILNVNRIHSAYELGVKVKVKQLENLKTLQNLTHLFMDINKIEVFDERIFKIDENNAYGIPPKVSVFTLAGDRLTFGRYLRYLFQVRGVTTIDISRQYMFNDPYFYRPPNGPESTFSGKLDSIFDTVGFTKRKRLAHVTALTRMDETEIAKLNLNINCTCDIKIASKLFCFPPDVKKVKWQKSSLSFGLSPLLVCGASRLEYLDVSLNHLQVWNGPILGLHNVKRLNLSDNYCKNLTATFFLAFTALEHLNISGNNMATSFDVKLYRHAGKIFINQKNMKSIDMSRIGLYRLPDKLFDKMSNLTTLILSDNDFAEWTLSLEKLRHLTTLDLSANRLAKLPETLTSYLDNSLALKNNEKVTVNLQFNSLECSCATLSFLKWIAYSKVRVLLHHSDHCNVNGERRQFKSVNDFLDIIQTLENGVCKDNLWVTWTLGSASTVAGMLLSLVASLLVYRNRWKLRYLYYNRHRRYQHLGYDRIFATDAMISYSKGKAGFIKDVAVPVLEGQHGLKLWVADRDSLPGVSVAENITHAINNSRKTVLMIDSEYLKDSWCDYDMNMAIVESVESKRSVIIAVLMEQFQMDKLPINILRFLQNETSLEFPQYIQDLDAFWTNLVSELLN